jgi:hypothetical protein
MTLKPHSAFVETENHSVRFGFTIRDKVDHEAAALKQIIIIRHSDLDNSRPD